MPDKTDAAVAPSDPQARCQSLGGGRRSCILSSSAVGKA